MFTSKLILYTLVLAISISTVAGVASDLTLPQAVIKYMATRTMRYHHFLWHNIRNNWNRLSNTTKQTITDLGWAPPRPSRSYNTEGYASQILDNGAGEDFFYMHRYMILKFNKVSEVYNSSFGDVVSWKTVPPPGDEDYPVPPNYTIPNTTTNYNRLKTDSFYYNTMEYYEKLYKDPDFLRSVSLGELGARIENTIHSHMHLRFSANSTYGFRPSISGAIPNISNHWDNATYDWMGDFYASHVNGYFWKLHGWVDDRIEDWRIANNLTSIRWNGTWIGGPMTNLSVLNKAMTMTMDSAEHDMEESEEMDDTMPQVMKLLLKEVPESTLADDVWIDPPKFKLPATPISSVTVSSTKAPKHRLRKRICKSKSRH